MGFTWSLLYTDALIRLRVKAVSHSMNPLTAPAPDLSPAQSSSRKITLALGVTTALGQNRGLLVYVGSMSDWRCAFPPAGLSVDGAAEWARIQGITLRPGDSYWSADEVAAANWDGLYM